MAQMPLGRTQRGLGARQLQRRESEDVCSAVCLLHTLLPIGCLPKAALHRCPTKAVLSGRLQPAGQRLYDNVCLDHFLGFNIDSVAALRSMLELLQCQPLQV
jgi:hypothetical protein